MSFTVISDRHGINSKVVALTFDDGPSEWTEPILDHLQAASAHATFFVLGKALEGREAIVRRAVAEDHELGVHTYNHPNLREAPDGEVHNEIAWTVAALGSITHEPTRFWRPPFFFWNDRVAELASQVGFGELVLCSINPRDWAPGAIADSVFDFILDRLEPGSIVDLHDGLSGRPDGSTLTRQVTVDAVAKLLPELATRGFRAVTLSELLVTD